jgi:RimJ/RimL family protein N-acetyltransferase
MTVLRGERVVLRPLRMEELDDLLEARMRIDDLPLTTGAAARRQLARQIANSGRFANGRLDFGVEAGGRLVGTIDARHPQGFVPSGVYELGIVVFDTGDRGKGYGAEAVSLLLGHAFETLNAGRIQAGTAIGNRAMRRVLEKLGFREEGVMRSFMPVGEGREDYVLYAITRDDWNKLGR